MKEVANRLRRLAELAVSVGVDVRPGQLVVIQAQLDHAPLARETPTLFDENATCHIAYGDGFAFASTRRRIERRD